MYTFPRPIYIVKNGNLWLDHTLASSEFDAWRKYIEHEMANGGLRSAYWHHARNEVQIIRLCATEDFEVVFPRPSVIDPDDMTDGYASHLAGQDP